MAAVMVATRPLLQVLGMAQVLILVHHQVKAEEVATVLLRQANPIKAAQFG